MPKDEPLFLIDPQPDALEASVRRVCGALLGLLVAGCLWFRWGPLGTLATGCLLVGCPVVCAALASQYGDRFWRAALRWW